MGQSNTQIRFRIVYQTDETTTRGKLTWTHQGVRRHSVQISRGGGCREGASG